MFLAVQTTTVSVTPIGKTSFSETVRIFDGDVQEVGQFQSGFATATFIGGGLYAIIFEPQSEDQLYWVVSSAGKAALNSGPLTNIVQPTDTNLDGINSAADALAVINTMSQQPGAEGAQVKISKPYMDVNRDGTVSAADALAVINRLSVTNSYGEGEGEVIPAMGQSSAIPRAPIDDVSQEQFEALVSSSAKQGASPDSTRLKTKTQLIDSALMDSTDWHESEVEAELDLLSSACLAKSVF